MWSPAPRWSPNARPRCYASASTTCSAPPPPSGPTGPTCPALGPGAPAATCSNAAPGDSAGCPACAPGWTDCRRSLYSEGVEEATNGRLGRPTAHLLLPCRSDSVPTVRALLHRDLERWDVSEAEADAILLAAGEAVTNAVVHGSWGQRDSVMVIRWAMTGGRFSFSVQDRGPGFESSRAAMSRRVHPSQNR